MSHWQRRGRVSVSGALSLLARSHGHTARTATAPIGTGAVAVRATADDRSVREGAPVAKRSITRSLMPIYAPISTSDRGNRSPHGSLLTTCSRESGTHACTIRRWAEALAPLPHRLGRADASDARSPPQPHLTAQARGSVARRSHRAPSVPAPLLAPSQGCLDEGRRSTGKAALPRVGFARPLLAIGDRCSIRARASARAILSLALRRAEGHGRSIGSPRTGTVQRVKRWESGC